MSEKQPFLIGKIAAFLRWFELLLFTISAPVLMAATGIAAIDILTGGKLLATQPGLLFAFGVALAIGIDILLPSACERVRDAWEAQPKRRWGTLFLWAVIAAWTGFVIFFSLQVFSIEQAQHVSEDQALLMIGISPQQFAFNRDLLAVVLLGLSGFARVHQRAASRAEERDYLQKELELEPLRQQLEAVKGGRLVGAVRTGKAVIAAAKAPSVAVASIDPDTDPTPPTSPTRPSRGRGSLQLTPAAHVELVSNPPIRPAARKRADRGVTAEKRLSVTNSRVQTAIQLMRVNPLIGPTELAEALNLDPQRYKGSMTRVLDQARLRMEQEKNSGRGAA